MRNAAVGFSLVIVRWAENHDCGIEGTGVTCWRDYYRIFAIFSLSVGVIGFFLMLPAGKVIHSALLEHKSHVKQSKLVHPVLGCLPLWFNAWGTEQHRDSNMDTSKLLEGGDSADESEDGGAEDTTDMNIVEVEADNTGHTQRRLSVIDGLQFPILRRLTTWDALKAGVKKRAFWVVVFAYVSGLTTGIFVLSSARSIWSTYLDYPSPEEANAHDGQWVGHIFTITSVLNAVGTAVTPFIVSPFHKLGKFPMSKAAAVVLLGSSILFVILGSMNAFLGNNSDHGGPHGVRILYGTWPPLCRLPPF